MGRSAFASSFDELARDLIATLFTHDDIVVKEITKTRGNPWEKSTAETVSSQTLKGAVLGPGERRWNGELVPEKTRIVYLDNETLTITPTSETVVSIDSVDHAVVSVKGYPEGATPSAYEITVAIG